MSYDSVITALSPAGRWKVDDANGQSTALATVGSNGTGNAAGFGATGLVNDGGTAWTNGAANNSLTLPLGARGSAGSIVLWYAWATGGTAGIPFLRDNTSTSGWFIDITGTNPVVRISGTSHTVTTVTASTLRDGNKHLYVLTTDGSTVTFYIDGVQVDQWTKAASFSGWNSSLIMGVNGAVGTQHSAGTWDDIAYWNSVIASTDVSNLWTAGTASASTGTASKTITISASAAAKLGVVGSATKTVTAAATAAGVRGKVASAAETITVTPSAAGVRGKVATAAAAVAIAATAAGIVVSGTVGDAAKTITISASAAAKLGVTGATTKIVTVTPTATGVRGKVATATPALVITATADGTVASIGSTVTWWDGTARQTVTVSGWWDGSALQPVTIDGWWDGSGVQPLA